jgi:2-polyprenyl-3-methyl-5-hydroxy-6-metoxy-1,4-benzoquinol methylase
MRKNIKKKIKEFYESDSYYGDDTSLLLAEYGTDGYEVKDPIRFMLLYKGQLKKIISMIPTGRDILDVGTGEGLLAGLLLGDARALTALDISRIRIKRCKEKYRNGQFIVGDAQELPFKSERFDCVVASEIIEHLIEPEKLLISSHYVLKKRGYMVISTPSTLFYENNLSELFKDPHLRTYSPRSLKSLLKKTGFKPVEIKGVGFKLRMKVPKLLAVIPRIIYTIIIRKLPNRGFIAPVILEWNLARSSFLNKLYIKNNKTYMKIFRFLNLLGNVFPSVAGQIIIKAEKKT